MKRLSLVCVMMLAASSLTLPGASAADVTPKPVAGCVTPTSKAHPPATLKQPTKPDAKLAKTMTIKTNCGTITIELNPAAPQTVTNMATLARAKYFDGTFCHRLTTAIIYVLQCGDPSAQANGSPGSWKGYKDENLPKVGGITYPAGTVAMANAGPNTNGSQFFLVYKDTILDPKYTIWGKIKTGWPILLRIQKAGAFKVDAASGQGYIVEDGYPVQPVEIKSVTVR